jgi:probable phosphomutase (TIGR03848 family)
MCLLVRHGSSTANESGTLAGWAEGIALTPRGEDQAKALGGLLADLPLAVVATSPLMRCRQTAEAIVVAQEGQPEIIVEQGLGECRYGAWTGRTLEDLAADPLWRTVQDVPSQAAFPDSQEYAGELLADMAHRIISTVRRLDADVAAQHGPASVWVAVTHGDPIKAVVADAAGAHFDHFQRIAIDPGSVSAIVYTPRRPTVLAVNLVGADLRRFIPAPDAAAHGGIPTPEVALRGASSPSDPAPHRANSPAREANSDQVLPGAAG